MTADIGLVGAGVMGSALALNLADNGYKVAVYGKSPHKVQACAAAAKEQNLKGEIIPCATSAEMVAHVRAPRPFLLLVPAGDAVDSVIAELRPLIDKGDLIIDAGNGNFHNTRERTKALEADGYAFLGSAAQLCGMLLSQCRNVFHKVVDVVVGGLLVLLGQDASLPLLRGSARPVAHGVWQL